MMMRVRFAAALALVLLCATPLASGEAVRSEPPAQATEPDESARNASPAAGTAVLLGAGAYTFVRIKAKEKKQESQKQEYVHFENHTRNGTLRNEEKYPPPF